MMKIGLIMPCYNVERTVVKVLTAFSEEVLRSLDEILCLDNCSVDNTFKCLLDLQKKELPVSRKLSVIQNVQNYNYGGSIKIAFQYFIERGMDSVIIVHSDDQGNTEQLVRNFLTEIEERPDSDLIITSRFAEGSDLQSYSKLRIWGNMFFTLLANLLTGLEMSDSGSALILIKTSVLKTVPFFGLTNGLHFHPQLNILIYGNEEFKVREIPIFWTDSEIPSNVRIIRFALAFLKLLIFVPINKSLGRTGLDLFQFTDRDFNPQYAVYPMQR